MRKSKEEFLLHYTSLQQLMDILQENRLQMKNPNMWKDRNDAFSVSKSSKKAVGVMCFSMLEDECNLFWESYANEGIGVCIVFKKSGIRNAISDSEQIFEFNEVKYLHFGENKEKNLCKSDGTNYEISEKHDLAFVKREAYDKEKELRLVLFSKKNPLLCGRVVGYLGLKPPIDNYIHEIRLSPFLDEKTSRDLKLLLELYLEKIGLEQIKVKISKIATDVKWRNAVLDLKKKLQKKNVTKNCR